MQVNPIIPMGAITGKPDRKKIRNILEDFRNVGIEQYMIYARSGLEIEYMSKEWLEVCRHIIEYAHENSIKIWIYDEYNWPSGKCAGKVIERNSEYACKKLSFFADSDFAGKSFDNRFGKKIYSSVSSIPLYADLLDPHAVDCFISMTHEVYADNFGQYFGNTVKGFFTDEPSFMYSANHNKTAGALLELPYFDGLQEEYMEAYGRNFTEDINAYLNSKQHKKLWYDFYQLLGKRFRNSYMDKIRYWCDEHNLLFTGHLMSEHSPETAIKASGQPMKAMKTFSLPGIDEICTNTSLDKIEWNTFKMCESAIKAGNRGGMAELFALGPCNMSIARMRQMIWLCALHGIDHYVTAVSSFDARANIEKAYYYNPFTKVQPWFDSLKELGEEAAQAAGYASKKAVYQVALRFPKDLTLATQSAINFNNLLKQLTNNQWQFMLIDEDEKTDLSIILTLTKNGIIEEHSGRVYTNIKELLTAFNSILNRPVSIYKKSGGIAHNLLLKVFEDETICVLNLSDKRQENLLLNNELAFDLEANGVLCFPNSNRPATGKTYHIDFNNKYNYRLSSKNSSRCFFNNNNVFEFELEDNLENIYIISRNYGDKVKLILDEKPLKSGDKCNVLPEGLKELYQQHQISGLGTGKHSLLLNSESKDYPYLPSAFIVGYFAVKNQNSLYKLPEKLCPDNFDFETLSGYAGTITFSFEADLSKYSQIDTPAKCHTIEILLNNKSIGRKSWSPYLWDIPENLRKKNVKIDLVLTNSIAPVFGNYPESLPSDHGFLEHFYKYWPK